jgi:hypothetical protein
MMRLFKKLSRSSVLLTLTLSSLGYSEKGAGGGGKPDQPTKAETSAMKRIEATDPTAQEEAIRLLLLGNILASKDYLPHVIDVPDRIREKYETLRSSVLGGGLVGGLTTAAFVALTYKSITETEISNKSLNAAWAKLKPSAEWSGRQWTAFWNLKMVRALGRITDKSSTWSSDKIRPVFKLIFTKGMGYAAGSSVAGSSLATSIYLYRNDSREIMSSATARYLLNYDEAFNRKLDDLVSKAAAIYTLEPYKQALLRNGIRTELMRQAIEKEFRTEDAEGQPIVYSVDLVKLMLSQNMIDLEIADAAERLQKIADLAWEHGGQLSTVERLGASVQTIIEIAALLESILETESLPEAMEMQVRQKLANTQKTLALLRNNLTN